MIEMVIASNLLPEVTTDSEWDDRRQLLLAFLCWRAVYVQMIPGVKDSHLLMYYVTTNHFP
jgi:hypothetical protein